MKISALLVSVELFLARPYIIYIGAKNILKIFTKIFAGSKKVATFATAFEKNNLARDAENRRCKVLEKKLRKNLQD